MPEVGIVWPRSGDVRNALQPLLDAGEVRALQLTVEHAFRGELGPGFTEPLDRAAAAGLLVGHAVYGSPYTTPRDRMTVDWLARTRRVLERWPVRWLTDHVGCCRVPGWNAAPVPLPGSRALVATVRAHLDWVGSELGVPVGLENLALAVSRDDVLLQPDLVDAMLRPSGGVLLLDLHNLWCQAVNFDLDPVALLERWPLDLVRQVHVAGGSWMDHPAGRFRRDTHDGAVPDAVFALVPEAVARCPALEVIVLERLRGTVEDPDDLRAEVHRLKDAVASVPEARDRDPGHEVGPAAWRTEDPSVQDGLFAALRGNDRTAAERLAPGWWQDDRAWAVGRDILERWGHPVPT
ncbi:MAG: DUF692 family protein [Myxococcota bacterium]